MAEGWSLVKSSTMSIFPGRELHRVKLQVHDIGLQKKVVNVGRDVWPYILATSAERLQIWQISESTRQIIVRKVLISNLSELFDVTALVKLVQGDLSRARVFLRTASPQHVYLLNYFLTLSLALSLTWSTRLPLASHPHASSRPFLFPIHPP